MACNTSIPYTIERSWQESAVSEYAIIIPSPRVKITPTVSIVLFTEEPCILRVFSKINLL